LHKTSKINVTGRLRKWMSGWCLKKLLMRTNSPICTMWTIPRSPRKNCVTKPTQRLSRSSLKKAKTLVKKLTNSMQEQKLIHQSKTASPRWRNPMWRVKCLMLN
jgi:hypothetical protein